MNEEQWVQCQDCGEIYHTNVRCDIDDLYIESKCPHCRGFTRHLIIGEHEYDIYKNYNLNVDPRYYKYKTK